MTTEEMLLQLIEGQKKTTEELSGFKEEFSSFKSEVNNRFDEINKRFDAQDKRLDNLESDVRSIKVTLENDVDRSIKLLLEMQLSNSERFQTLEKDVREIKDTLAINEVIEELKENRLI